MNDLTTPRQPDEAADDADLLDLLTRALGAAEPLPDHVADGARAAFTWRTIDAELAEIVFDSAVTAGAVRSDERDRQITFQAPGVEIEVVVVDDDVRRLVGQLVPPASMTLDVIGGDTVTTVVADLLGRFTVDDVEPGPVRLVVRDADGGAVVQTEWILL